MKRLTGFFLFVCACAAGVPPGEAGTLAGTVEDAQTAVPLKGASVMLTEIGRGTQTDARPKTGWRNLTRKNVHPEVHPRSLESLLDYCDDARLARAWRAVQDDDPTWCRLLIHVHSVVS